MVVTKLSKVEGMITEVKIDFDCVIYNITYFIDGKFSNSCMNEFEFDVINTQKITIGFRK